MPELYRAGLAVAGVKVNQSSGYNGAMTKGAYRTNRLLWGVCAAIVFCLFLAFEPGIGLKAPPIRDAVFDDRGEIVKALLLFAIPSAVLGWPLQAIAVVAWSKLTGRSREIPDSK